MKIVEYLTETGGLFFLISRIRKKNRRIGMNVSVFVMETWLAALKLLYLVFLFFFFYSTLGLSFNADHECCHSFFYATSLETGHKKNSLKPKNKWAQPSESLLVYISLCTYEPGLARGLVGLCSFSTCQKHSFGTTVSHIWNTLSPGKR